MSSAPPPAPSDGGHQNASLQSSGGHTSSGRKAPVPSTAKKRKSSAPPPSVASIPSVPPNAAAASYSAALASAYGRPFQYQAVNGLLPYPLNQPFAHHPRFYQGVAPPAPVAPPLPPAPPHEIITQPVARHPSASSDLTSEVSSRPSAGDSVAVGGERMPMMPMMKTMIPPPPRAFH